MTDAGTISIERKKSWIYSGGKLKVFVDGKSLGDLPSGEEREFSVESGDHQIEIRSAGWPSPLAKLPISVSEGMSNRFEYGVTRLWQTMPFVPPLLCAVECLGIQNKMIPPTNESVTVVTIVWVVVLVLIGFTLKYGVYLRQVKDS
jgi:hypothetical protein